VSDGLQRPALILREGVSLGLIRHHLVEAVSRSIVVIAARTVINDKGEMIYDGKVMTSLSAAATAITDNSVNGWNFWEARRPGDTGFTSMVALRATVIGSEGL
jgi:hypothetical protein